jgi:L-glutamine:2-deoxy-scyllo-inosose/3-amino-2,3-dideoxy-scyllo-inosose aminotransferase
MKRHTQITRQSYYCLTFRYDSTAWDGVPVGVFRRALGAEVGLGIGTTYPPLNGCLQDYNPHSKRRHHLNDVYWEAIDPRRFALPVCRKAFEQEAVVLGHSFLLSGLADMDDIVMAIAKLYDHRVELGDLA